MNILGTEYKIEYKKEDEDFETCSGYCDINEKRIAIEITEDDKDGNLSEFTKKVVRHEIIHAFLYESGLSRNSTDGWAINEEIIDWIAIQAPKFFKIFNEEMV